MPIDIIRDNQLEEVGQLVANGRWNAELLQQNFSDEVSNHVINYMCCNKETEHWDKPLWLLNVSIKFSVSYAWEYLREKEESKLIYRTI